MEIYDKKEAFEALERRRASYKDAPDSGVVTVKGSPDTFTSCPGCGDPVGVRVKKGQRKDSHCRPCLDMKNRGWL